MAGRGENLEIAEMQFIVRQRLIRLNAGHHRTERTAVAVERAVKALLNQRRAGARFVPVGKVVANRATFQFNNVMIVRVFNTAEQQVAARMTQHKAVHHNVVIFRREFRGGDP